MSARPTTLKIESLATIHAAAAEGASPPRFDVVAYTGGALSVAGYEHPIVIDLAGLSSRKAIIANLDHDPQKRVGHVTQVHNDGQTLRLEGVASAATPAREEVIASAREGFPWQASVEVVPSRVVLAKDGKEVEVNGQVFAGPVYIARRSKLMGFAFVPHGADDNTFARIAAGQKKEEAMEFTQWLNAKGLDEGTLSQAELARLKAEFDAQRTCAGAADTTSPQSPPQALPGRGARTPASPHSYTQEAVFDLEDIKAAASEHLAQVEAEIAKYEDSIDARTLATIKAASLSQARKLKAQALSERWTVEHYEMELVRAMADVRVELVKAQRPQGPAIHATRRDLTPAVIEAGLCQSLRLPKIERHFEASVLENADRAFRGRLGLKQLLVMAAEANGYPHRTYTVDAGNLRELMRYAFPPVHASSTFSLAGILSNVANKELLAGYEQEDSTWRTIAAVRSVNDFKQVTSYRLLDNMEYEELAPNGRIAHGQISEESYTRQVRTYAKMFALSRQDIINDDLSAFEELRRRLGAGAARKFNNVFWATFMANSSFFTSARGNYIQGAGTALGLDGAGLEEGLKAFYKLKTPDGKRLGGQPTILLVPQELLFIAQRLYASVETNPGGGSGVATAPNRNIHFSKYQPVMSPWLSDPTFTGASATAWYLLRDPSVLPSVVVSFLNGVETPTVESADADFDMLGVQFRGYHDFGVDLAEYLAGIKSKGAA
jgi:phage major head subunit gpT-like protein